MREQQSKQAALPLRDADDPGQQPQRRGLDRQKADQQQCDTAGPGQQQAEIDRHAHRNEEQPEQQPLERLDIGFQGMPVFRTRQQHTGQKSAQRHRQADLRHQLGNSQHQQQGKGRKHFSGVRRGDQTQSRPCQVAAYHDDAGDGGDRLQGVQPGSTCCCGVGGKQWNGCKERDCRNVLKQQDGEGAAPGRRWQKVAFAHGLHGDGGRGQGQRKPSDDCQLPVEAEGRSGGRQGKGTGQHLQATVAEDFTTHGPQTLRVKFQADQEQHQDHAKL